MKTSITLFFTLMTLTVFAQLNNASFEESDSLPLSVDAKDLQSGIYVVHLLQNSKVMAVRKIVVSD